MKIAFNAVRVTKKLGSGFDTFIINFINEFAKICPQDVKFDVFTLYPEHFPDVKRESIKQIKIPFFKKVQSLISAQSSNHLINKSPNHLVTQSLNHYIKDWFRFFWTQFVFPIYTKKYDFIISMTQLDACFFCQTKQIVFVYDLIPFLFRDQKHKYRFFIYNLLPSILKAAHKIMAISENTKKDLISVLGVNENKIDVIYPGLDSKIVDCLKSIDERENKIFTRKYHLNKYMFFLTSGGSHKNLTNILKAYKVVSRRIIDLDLVVAGNTRKYDISEKVRFLGHVDTKDLVLFYFNASVFVFPSLYEGFGLPVLEAMACGCPVVVSSRGALPEVVGDAGVYVDPYNPQDIADGIMKVLSDEGLRLRLIQKGYERVKKFSWENSARKFLEIIEKGR